jgi:AraC-like DNA-binding protein
MPLKLTQKDTEALHMVKGLLESSAELYTIPQLVRKSGLNEDKLKKGFKNLFGMPVHKYHLDFKMKAAGKLLEETELHVSEIAYELGYEDASNFCAAFKRMTGVAAGEWRKRALSKNYPEDILNQNINS